MLPPPKGQQEIYVAIWAKVIDTQMHFNDMSVKARQFGLGFVSAALGLGVVLLTKSDEFSWIVYGYKVHVSALIAFASAAALYAVRILDLNVYHQMLRGAVAFGEDFEENYMKQIFVLNKGMTQAISHFSRMNDADRELDPISRRYTYVGVEKITAFEKIRRFYKWSIAALMLIGALLLVVPNLPVKWQGGIQHGQGYSIRETSRSVG